MLGTSGIVPIGSAQALQFEAVEQHNCLAGPWFVDQILASNFCVYRVLQPERASLAVSRAMPGEPWTVHELKAAHNADVSRARVSSVQKWLNRVRILDEAA